MNEPGAGERAELGRRISARENQVDDDLRELRLLDERWESYRRVMGERVTRFEEASRAAEVENYDAQRDLAAMREVASFVERLVVEQGEVCVEATRLVRADGEAEIERLRSEWSELPWD